MPILEGLEMKKLQKRVFPDSTKERIFFDFEKLNGANKVTVEDLKNVQYKKVYTKEDRKKANKLFYKKFREVNFD